MFATNNNGMQLINTATGYERKQIYVPENNNP
jgi:hypothetical protein